MLTLQVNTSRTAQLIDEDGNVVALIAATATGLEVDFPAEAPFEIDQETDAVTGTTRVTFTLADGESEHAA